MKIILVIILKIIGRLISCSFLIPYKVQGTQKDPLEKNDIKPNLMALNNICADIHDIDVENLKGEDGIGVEEYGGEPKGVEVVQAGKHNLLVHIEPACTKVRRCRKGAKNQYRKCESWVNSKDVST